MVLPLCDVFPHPANRQRYLRCVLTIGRSILGRLLPIHG